MRLVLTVERGRFSLQKRGSCWIIPLRRWGLFGDACGHFIEAEGEVSFSGAEIGGDLDCGGGTFSNPIKRAAKSRVVGDALSLSGAKVHGVLSLGPAAKFFGSIDLQGAHAREFIDDAASCGTVQVDDEELPCALVLDGFTYDRLSGGTPTDARSRKEWLMRQPEAHLGSSFRPQPFEQLIKVLKDMGHTQDAREIGYFKEYRRLRKPWRPRQWLNPLSWLWYFCRWLFLEQALGYGYRPHRMVFLAIAVFIAFGFVYGQAAKQGLFAPSNPRVLMDQDLRGSCADPPQWTGGACNLTARVPEYTKFYPYVYSLDVILPIVSLKQREDWQPIYRPLQVSAAGWPRELPPYFVPWLVWIESIFAWVWTLSLSAVATGIIKRD